MIDAFLQDYSDSLPPKGRPCTAFLMIWWTVPDEIAAEMRHLAKADAQALPASINTRVRARGPSCAPSGDHFQSI